jgi:enoyl-[acyl-carrier-protein] reductase (NADH)
VHSLANGPEVTKPLLETSRKGYLAAMSASSYSFVSMMQRFGPIMNPGGAAISLTYIASEDVIPGYGGGMSSAKAVSLALSNFASVFLQVAAVRLHTAGLLLWSARGRTLVVLLELEDTAVLSSACLTCFMCVDC